MPRQGPWRLWRWSAIGLSICLGLGLLASAPAWGAGPGDGADIPEEDAALSASAIALPGGFASEVVASGLSLPTAFASLPDGRIFIAEKHGVVRLFKHGALQPTPVIDLRARVNSYQDRGLLSLALDPDFATNGFLYLLYTFDDDATDDTGPKTGRLARYTVVGDSASPDSELVLLGSVVGSSCNALPKGSDCIPSDATSHSVADLAFAPDGSLFVALGDATRADIVADMALLAQDVDWLGGKLLRISRTGQGLASNPFWSGDPNANRSKVWASGLRNPFRVSLHPVSGTPYVGDVGWNYWEEVHTAPAGANLGWPCYSGVNRQSGYSTRPTCQALYARGASAVRPPLHAYNHTVGKSVVGGVFYTGTDYPEAYRGAYFFGDYTRGWLHVLRVDAQDTLVPGSAETFATDANGPVDIDMGPDGRLYYLSILEGQLRRLRYTAGNSPPTAVASATPRQGAPPLLVRFSSEGSSDPDGDPLQFHWDFGDGSAPVQQASPEHTYAAAGAYQARLTVSDGRGGSHSESVSISVGNLAPVPTIASPSEAYRFRVGDVVVFAGSASDAEDGAIPPSGLSWTITLHHCTHGECHTHPYTSTTGEGGTFVAPDHSDEVFFELTLTATDSAGLTGRATVLIRPQTVQLTLRTSPPGLQVGFDGMSGPEPLTVTAIVGSMHSIHVPSPQGGHLFQSWSDGGEAQHTVTVGASDVTYTARFEAPAGCPVGQFQAEYFNNPTLTGAPVLVRCEAAPLNHYWPTDSPAPGIVNADNFSVRWTGWFTFQEGTTTFNARADDGVRVRVDGALLIDGWKTQPPTTYKASRFLTAGTHQVVMEYYEDRGGAVAKLWW
jgi:glucose/arabinose dehydrogenase